MSSINRLLAAFGLILVVGCSSGTTEETARVQPPVLVNDDLAPAATTTTPAPVAEASGVQVAPGNSATASVCNPNQPGGCGSCPDGAGCDGNCGQAAQAEPAGCGSCAGGSACNGGCDQMAQAEASGCGSCAGGAACNGACGQAEPAGGGNAMADMVPPPADFDPAQAVRQPGAQVGDITTCPVSGEVFQVTANSARTTHNGQEIYFCCRGCIRRFQRNPDGFLGQ